MKFLKQTLGAFVCFLLLVGNASASVQIWQKVVGEDFPIFDAAMQERGWVSEKGYKVEGISAAACSIALNKGLITESAKDKESCTKLFPKRNGLAGEFISVKDFMNHIAKNGIHIDSIKEMEKSVTAINKSDIANKVQATEIHLEALNAEVKAGTKSNNSFKASVNETLNDMSRNLGALKNKLTVATGKELDDRVKAKVDAAAKVQEGQYAVLNNRVNGLEGGAKDVKDRLDRNEVNNNETKGTVGRLVSNTTAGFALIFFVLLALAFIIVKLFSKVKKQGDVLFGKGTIPSLSRKIESLEDVVSTEIEGLKQAHQQLAEKVLDFDFDESEIQPDKLEALEVGERFELFLTSVDDGNEYRLEVEKTGENKITVYGAFRQLGQTAPLVIDSMKGVPAKIHRAARDGRIKAVKRVASVTM